MTKKRESAELTRLNILDSALKVFVEKSYDKATLNDIANEAGVTRGAVYWHFKNKFDILKNINTMKGDNLLNKILEIMSKEKKPINRILKMFDSFCDLIIFDEKFMLFRKLIEFKISDSEEIKEILESEEIHLKKLKEILILIINEGKEQGDIKQEIDSEFLAVTFLNWGMGLQRIWMQFKNIYDIKENKELILKNILQMIKV